MTNFCASDRGNTTRVLCLPEYQQGDSVPSGDRFAVTCTLQGIAMTNRPARAVAQPEYYSRFGGSTSTVQPINGSPFSIVVGSGPRRMICQRKRPNNLRV